MIDLLFTNMDHCNSSGTLDLFISDHQPIFVVKKKLRNPRVKMCFSGRSYLGYSKDLLSDALTNDIKAEFRHSGDPNHCWNLMETFLTNFLDLHCPIKTFRTKENTPAWVTRDIIILAKDRDRAWMQAKLTNSDEDWAIARRLRNWTNNATKAAKAAYIQNEINANSSNPKKFWRNIKDVLPGQTSGNINIINPLTKEILPKELQAQEINDFFSNIGDNLAKKFNNNVADLGERPHVQELALDNITQVEVLKLIDSISVNKSSGLDK